MLTVLAATGALLISVAIYKQLDLITYLTYKAVEHILANTNYILLYVGTLTLTIYYLRQRKWALSVITFFIGFLWLGYYRSTFGYIGSLGVDSFHESGNFERIEALFWFKTFVAQFKFSLRLDGFILYSGIALAFYVSLHCATLAFSYLHPTSAFRYLRGGIFSLQPLVGSILIISALYGSVGGVVELFFKNSQSFKKVAEKFENVPPSVTMTKKINVLLYIGESASVMNMGLYGYHRNNNPLLSNLEKTDDSFLKFENVFSTHTHTSPSLLEALSIGVDVREDVLPITDRRRISIVDILNKAGVSTEIYSNQGQTGTWNFASSIVFKNIGKKIFSTDSIFAGNAEDRLMKPWDDQFFRTYFRTEELDKKSSALMIFHSYAGHGPYSFNIPPSFRDPVDHQYRALTRIAITGQMQPLQLIENYDSAIKYIDFAVFNAIETVRKSIQPSVFIYFADHGEAVFPSRAHDSSRFIHEMARVPFVIYFNDAAREVYPELFQKYTRLSKTNNIGTLAQLPSTIFDLLGVALDPSKKLLPVIGTMTPPPPIVLRQTADGVTAINLSSQPLTFPLIDKTDTATQHFVAVNSIKENMQTICYHRSNSIAKALRGSLVANCLEIDIMVDSEGKILAYHPPAENTGLSLNDIFAAVKSNQKLAFWLDGKNLNSQKKCDSLQIFLANETPEQSMGVLVEFPSGSHKIANKIANCLRNLIEKDLIHTSYYVPTGLAVHCSNQILSGVTFKDASSCRSLEVELAAVKNTGLFTDISFDYSGLRAIEEIDFLSSLSWNTWHVKAEELTSLSPSRFRMIILINNDPNNI